MTDFGEEDKFNSPIFHHGGNKGSMILNRHIDWNRIIFLMKIIQNPNFTATERYGTLK
jgi:hypothetical protein